MGGVDTQDAAILSLFSGGGRRGGGIGVGGNDAVVEDVLAAGSLADGTAVNAKIDCVNDKVTANHLAREFDRVNDRITDGEGRTADRLRDQSDKAAENQAALIACCCASQLEAAKSHAELLAAIAASENRGIERELNEKNAKITQLETINALRDNGHGRS